MAKAHKTNPKVTKNRWIPYTTLEASSDAQADLIAELVAQGIRRSRKAITVEYLLDHKKEIRAAIKSLFDPDAIELKKFIIKQFYKDVLLLNIDTKLMNYRDEGGFGMFMHIPAQLSFEDVVERLRRKGKRIHLTEQQVKDGGGRLGYPTCYSFLFHAEDFYENHLRNKAEFENFSIRDPRRRLMNRTEYLICKIFMEWYLGMETFTEQWSLLESKPGSNVITIAHSSVPQGHRFIFLPVDEFGGFYSFGEKVNILRVREIYLL